MINFVLLLVLMSDDSVTEFTVDTMQQCEKYVVELSGTASALCVPVYHRTTRSNKRWGDTKILNF